MDKRSRREWQLQQFLQKLLQGTITDEERQEYDVLRSEEMAEALFPDNRKQWRVDCLVFIVSIIVGALIMYAAHRFCLLPVVDICESCKEF